MGGRGAVCPFPGFCMGRGPGRGKSPGTPAGGRAPSPHPTTLCAVGLGWLAHEAKEEEEEQEVASRYEEARSVA